MFGRKITMLVVLMLCILAGACWIYNERKQITRYEDTVNALQREITDLNVEIENLIAEAENLNREMEDLLYPKDGVMYNGWLSVEGSRLVNAHGESLQLRGVSSHGIMWYPEYGNYRAIMTTKEQGANVFRAAMYTTEKGGYDENPKEALRTLKTIVENALGADMYIIVDWHVLREKNPNVYVEEAVLFFDEISRIYADEPGVIYEICNEPNGDTGWDDIKKYAERVIPVIRANSPDALILVGTPDYCVDIKEAADDPLPYENIMYTYHYYAVYDQGGYDRKLSYAMEKGCAVFISEWGVGGAADRSGMDVLLEKADVFMDYLDENGISWVSWALSNKEESHSLIVPESALLSNWTQEDLTLYGKFIFNRLGKD